MMKMIKYTLGSLLITISLFSFTAATSSTWQPIGFELNINETKNAHDPVIAIDASTPYVAWSEFDGDNSAYQIVLSKHNGSSWETINPSLNMIPTDNATSPTTLFRGSEIIIAWVETDLAASRIYTKSVILGTGSTMLGSTALNENFNKDASNPSVAYFQDSIHVAWAEQGSVAGQSIQIAKYNVSGNDWLPQGAGISIDPMKISSEPVLAPDQGSPYKAYIAWIEDDGNANQLYVKRFNGSTWEEPRIGALNKIASKDAKNPDLKVYNGTPYICWSENTDTVPKIYVKHFNGSDWTPIGGALNFNSTKAAINPSMEIETTGRPIVTWQENTATGQVIRVAGHNGSDWFFKNDILNNSSDKDGIKPSIAILDSEPIVAWQETTTQAEHIYVKHWSVLSSSPTPDGSGSPTPDGSATPGTTPTPDGSATPGATPTPDTNTTPDSTPNKTPTPLIDKEQKVKIKDNVFQPGKGVPVSIEVPIITQEKVVIKIYNRRGQLIKTVVDKIVDPGDFQAIWDGQNEKKKVVGSGVYIVHIKTDSINEKRKIAVVQ